MREGGKVLLLCFNFLIVVLSEQKLKQLQNSQYVQLQFLTKTRGKVTVLKTKQDTGVVTPKTFSLST